MAQVKVKFKSEPRTRHRPKLKMWRLASGLAMKINSCRKESNEKKISWHPLNHRDPLKRMRFQS